MSRFETYDLFWMSETLSDLAARHQALKDQHLANSAYVRYGSQLFLIKEVKRGEFEEVKVSGENLAVFDKIMRLSELKDRYDHQKERYSARRALDLEEMVIIETILAGRYHSHQSNEDLPFRSTLPFPAVAIGQIERAVFAQNYFRSGDVIVKPPEPVPENWNIPITNNEDYLVKRTTLREKLIQSFPLFLDSESNKTRSKPVVITALCGLGGIGKTQLALDYLHNSIQSYTYRIWFNAESSEQLNRNYRQFCDNFHIELVENATDGQVVSSVNGWFSSHSNWLLVYDNAPNKHITSFFPKGGCGDILVTSRSTYDWPGPPIPVDVLEKEQAMELVKCRIRKDEAEAKLSNAEEGALVELINELGNLPLALAQAAACIARDFMTIVGYLKEYRSVTTQKLEENFLGHQCDEIILLPSEDALPQEAKDYEPHTVYLVKASSDRDDKVVAFWSHNREKPNRKELSFHDLKEVRSLVFPQALGKVIKIKITEQIILVEEILSLINYNDSIEYPKPAATTWLITMERIRRQEPNALTVLQGCAYLAPDQIPKEVLQAFLLKHQTETRTHESIDKLMRILREYSMLTDQSPNAFNIHRVVQEVIRSYLQKQGEEKKADPLKLVEQVCSSLNQSCPRGHQDMKTIRNRRRWMSHLEKAIKNYQQINKGIPGQALVAATSLLGDIYLGDWNDPLTARRYLEEAKDIIEKYYAENKLQLIRILTDLSAAYGGLGNPEKQYFILKHVLEIQKNYYKCEDHVDMIRTLIDLGAAAIEARGGVDEQLVYLEQAVRIQEKYGKDQNKLAKILGSLGIAFLFIKNFSNAKRLFKQVLKIQEKSRDDNQIEIAITLNGLSHAHWALGEYKEQKERLDQSLAIQIDHYGEKHFEVARTRVNLSSFYEATREWDKAIEQLQIALPILKVHYGETHRVVKHAVQTLYDIVLKRGAIIVEYQDQSPSVDSLISRPSAEVTVRGITVSAEGAPYWSRAPRLDYEASTREPKVEVIVEPSHQLTLKTKPIGFYTRGAVAAAEGAEFWAEAHNQVIKQDMIVKAESKPVISGAGITDNDSVHFWSKTKSILGDSSIIDFKKKFEEKLKSLKCCSGFSIERYASGMIVIKLVDKQGERDAIEKELKELVELLTQSIAYQAIKGHNFDMTESDTLKITAEKPILDEIFALLDLCLTSASGVGQCKMQ